MVKNLEVRKNEAGPWCLILRTQPQHFLDLQVSENQVYARVARESKRARNLDRVPKPAVKHEEISRADALVSEMFRS